MAYIPYIEQEDASAELRALYDRYGGPARRVDNILKIHSLNPLTMEAHYQLYSALMQGQSELTTVQREMIAVVVSSINECHY